MSKPKLSVVGDTMTDAPNDFQRFTKVEEMGKDLARLGNVLWVEVEGVIDKAIEKKTREWVEIAIARVENNMRSAKWFDETLVRFGAEMGHFLRDELYDVEDDGHVLKRDVVKRSLIDLVDSFPTASVPNLRTYLSTMIDTVHAERPDPCALETACRKMKRTLKKLPTIADVLEAIEEAKQEWADYWEHSDEEQPYAVENMTRSLERLHALLEEIAPPPAP